MAGKYTPLENYLRDLPANQKEVALSFEQIERILNAKLPPSAYEYRHGGKMRKRATMSMRVHGQMLAGRLRALISTGNK